MPKEQKPHDINAQLRQLTDEVRALREKIRGEIDSHTHRPERGRLIPERARPSSSRRST
jgi:hypothetical protein